MIKRTDTEKIPVLKKEETNMLEADMRNFGYLLPTNDQELEEFEKIYGNTQVIFPEHLKSPDFLFKKKNKLIALEPEKTAVKEKSPPKNAIIKPNKNDYFKKIVLAAEIAYQLYEEPTFGHKKFVKVLYLCQEVCNMKLSTFYAKHAAGPLDGKFMHSIDKEFEEQKWFKKVARDSYGFKYVPLEKVENYKKYYTQYFGDQAESINNLILLFKKEKSDFCEVVATLYAVWRENIINKVLINNATLIKGFYQWHQDKRKFQETQLVKAIEWMTQKGIVPVNF